MHLGTVMKFSTLLRTIEVEDVPIFIRGGIKDFSFPFLRANWIARDGLKLNKHVQKPEKFRGVLFILRAVVSCGKKY